MVVDNVMQVTVQAKKNRSGVMEILFLLMAMKVVYSCMLVRF